MSTFLHVPTGHFVGSEEEKLGPEAGKTAAVLISGILKQIRKRGRIKKMESGSVEPRCVFKGFDFHSFGIFDISALQLWCFWTL